MRSHILSHIDELPEADASGSKPTDLTGGSLSNWAVEAVTKLLEAGVFQNPDNNGLQPQSVLNRGQAAAALYSLLNRQTMN